MQVGDQVATLYGCNWPVILRQSEDAYEFVGLAYIDQVVYGEAVREHRAKNNPDHMFTIC